MSEKKLIKEIDKGLLKWRNKMYKEYSQFLEIIEKWKLYKKLKKGDEK